MSASDRTLICGTLLAMCVSVSGAGAMDAKQTGAAGAAGAASFPTYLEGSRIDDLQQAWSARVERTPSVGAEQAKQDAQQLESFHSTISTARSAARRAEQASEDAATVRRKAEELSRRFSAGGAVTTSASAPGAEDKVPRLKPVETMALPSAVTDKPTAAAALEPTGDAAKSPALRVEHSNVVHAPPRDADSGPTKPFGIGAPLPAPDAKATHVPEAPSVVVEPLLTARPVPPMPHRAPEEGAAKSPQVKVPQAKKAAAAAGSAKVTKAATKPKGAAKVKSAIKTAKAPAATGKAAKAAADNPPASRQKTIEAQAAASAPPVESTPMDRDRGNGNPTEVFSSFLRSLGWNSGAN